MPDFIYDISNCNLWVNVTCGSSIGNLPVFWSVILQAAQLHILFVTFILSIFFDQPVDLPLTDAQYCSSFLTIAAILSQNHL